MTDLDLRGRLTVTVPEAGRMLGLGRDAAYAAAERGEIPSVKMGRRLVVPTLPATPARRLARTPDRASARDPHRKRGPP